MRKLFFSIIATLAACSSYNPDLGDAPYFCPKDECPSGYTCTMTAEPAPRDKVCISNDGVGPDASMPGFQCNDDSPLEGGSRNDTPMSAYQTPVAAQRQDVALAGLAICPEGDLDFYAINLVQANQGIEIIASWDSGQPIQMSLTNATGGALVNGTAMGDKALRACAANLTSTGSPTGTFFAKVFAASSTKNNYRLSIKQVAACAP